MGAGEKTEIPAPVGNICDALQETCSEGYSTLDVLIFNTNKHSSFLIALQSPLVSEIWQQD